MSRLSARLARLAVVLIGLILIGLAVLHLPPVRARVLDRVRGYAQQEFGIALQASSLGYNLLTRSIELRDLSLAATSNGQPFVQADRAVVVLDPAIYLGRFDVSRIAITRPRLTLVRNADGSVNLPPSRPSESASTPLQFGVVSVTGLSVTLDDRGAGRSFAVGPFDLSMDTRDSTGRPGAFGPGGFRLRTGQIDLSGTIAGRLAFDGTRLRIEELIADTRPGRLVINGWADVIGERPALSAKANVTVDLAEATRLARVDARGLGGRLDGVIDVSGGLTAPVMALTMTSRDALYPRLGAVRLNGRGSFSGTRGTIETLDVDSTAGSLHAEGAIELGEAAKAAARTPSHLALRWSNLRIDDLARASGRPLAVPTGSLATGSATVDFAAGDSDISRLRAEATTTFQPVSDKQDSVSLALAGQVDLDLDRGTWSLRHSMRMPRAQASAEGRVTGRLLGSGPLRSTLGGRSELRATAIERVVSLIRRVGSSDPTLPEALEDLAGSMRATVDLSGTLERPRAHIDLAARDLKARVLPNAADLDARFDVDADALRVQQAQAHAGSTSLQAAGRYSWRGPFDARFEADQRDFSEIANQYALPVSLTGSGRLEGTVTGTFSARARSGQAVLALSAADVVIDQVAVGAVNATGTVSLESGGLITVDATAPGVGGSAKLEIVNSPGYPVSGEIALEHDQINGLIPPRYREQAGDLSGKVSAIARGSGRLADPAGIRGRIDLRAVDVTMRGTRIELAGARIAHAG